MQNLQQQALASTRPSVSAVHVLLVDDDPVFRKVTSSFLIHQGYHVTEAENGLDGLQQLSAKVPDLVLCDLSMPILDGIEFVEEIQLEYPSLPIIVVSATEQMSDVAKALRFGIKDFLPKPIGNYENLLSAIDNTLEDSSDLLADKRDFSGRWFRVDDDGEIPEEKELYWHLNYLQDNPGSAKDRLHALLPPRDTSQGSWKCQYRLLQSSEAMPLVFDYAWTMDGQFAFYIVDSNSVTNSVGTVLLVRALFDDYLRNVRTANVDLKEIASMVEKGLDCSESTPSINALFGVADLASGSISILPAGLDSQWKSGQSLVQIGAGEMLGENCVKNFITQDVSIETKGQLIVTQLGSSSFCLDISRQPMN